MKKSMLMLAIVAGSVPLCGLNAQSCVRQPMPSPGVGVGWTADNWPRGETIRFSALASGQPHAYAAQISRASPGAGAIVHLARLAHGHCWNWVADQQWTFPLGATETRLFFERAGEIEARVVPDQYLVLDGTAFQYAHRQAGVMRQLSLSPTAMGESGRLSSLIQRLMVMAGGEIPDGSNWSEY